MTALEIIKIIAAIGTILTGAISLARPRSVQGFTGLSAPGARGITEIRAVLGGAFIGLGAAPLLLNTPAAYQMLGITYLAIGLARIIGIFLDRSTERSNYISLVVEIVFGILLVV
jgi:hypothetical protein